MVDRKRAVKDLVELADAIPKAFPPSTTSGWERYLRPLLPLNPQEWARALDTAMEKCSEFPSAAELLRFSRYEERQRAEIQLRAQQERPNINAELMSQNQERFRDLVEKLSTRKKLRVG